MAFLHAAPEQLSRQDCDTDPDLVRKLEAFRAKAKRKLCRFWKNREELIIAVLTSYQNLVHDHPAIGWVRADHARTAEDLDRLAKLQERIEQLEETNRELQERADASGSGLPNLQLGPPDMPTEFRSFARDFRIQWETERDSEPMELHELRALLYSGIQKVIGLLVRIDEHEYSHIAQSLRDVVVSMKELVHETDRAQTGIKPRDDIWIRGDRLLTAFKHIQGDLDRELKGFI